MIIFDFNQIVIANLMEQIGSSKKPVESDLVRHMILNSLRTYIKKFKSYGQVVIACDNKKYWRRDVFPYYKGNRKKSRDDSGHDWESIFACMNMVRQELKTYSPYKILDVDGAEADDIIGTLVPIYARDQKILILSSDGDFLQLQQYGPNVKQYNPSQKKYIKSENPILELKEKIIRGDKGDGIPNMFSPSDCFVRDLRQKPITKTIIDQYLWENVEEYNDTDKTNFARNSTLIDLTKIPADIKEKIINTYDETKPASRQKLLNYFMEHKLKNLMDVIEEF